MSTTEDQIPWVRIDQPKPKPKPKAKPKPRAKPKGFLQAFGDKLKNDVAYELKRLKRNPIVYGATMAPRAARQQFGPGLAPVVGALSDANRMAYSLYQRKAQGVKSADPSRGQYGSFIDSTEEALYRFAGRTPPAAMTGKQRGEDSFVRQMVPYLLTGPIGAKALGAARATTAAGAIVRGAGAGIVADLLATPLTDNRGGNVINMINDLTGAKLPGGVNVGRDDMVDSALKSAVPNAAFGAVIGAGIDIGIQKFPATLRWLRGKRAVEEVKASRGRTVAAGLQEQAEDGTYRFKMPTPEEAAADPVAAFKKLDEWGAEPAAPAAAAPEPAPAPKAPASEPDTELLDELPDSIDDLPEIDAVERTVRQLDDEELLQAADTPEPVVDTVNNLLDERVPVEPDPNLRMDLVSAPTDKLSDSYINGIGAMDPWEQLIEGAPINRLRMVAANSPDYSEKIQSMTGRGPDEWTRDDLVDGAKAMSQQGRTIITSRIRGNQEWVPTADLGFAPEVFQYKGGVNAAGEQAGSSLGDVKAWDPTSEGTLLAWRDPEGKAFVVNGHNRRALAERTGIPSLPVKWSEASTAAGARMEGAIQNINDGKGTAFDAAKFIRDSGITDEQQLVAAGMPLESGWGRQGLALSKLPQDVFDGVGQDESLLRKAVLVGESGLPPEGMRGAFRLLKEKPGIKEGVFRELLAQKSAAPPPPPAKQGDILTGTEWDMTVDETMLARAELADKVTGLLKKRKRVFSNAGSNASQLEAAGNTIDKAGARQISTDAERTARQFDQLKYQSGPVADLLNKGVQQVMDGGKIDVIARQLDEQLGPQLELGALNNPVEVPPPVEAPAVDPNQGDMFGAPAEMPPVELTAGERESIRVGILERAIADGEVRPSVTPEPELPPGPVVSLEEARADAAARGGIAPGSPAAQGVADEYRLQKTFERDDNLLRQDQEDALRDAYGYNDLTFEEKKKVGMLEGWEDEPVQVAAAEPGAPGALVPPPPRPVPVRISQAPPFDGVPVVKTGQFTPPEKLKPGRADLMATGLANRLGVTRDEAIALINTKGLINYDKVMGPENYLKSEDIIQMGMMKDEALQARNIARQFYGLPEFRVGPDFSIAPKGWKPGDPIGDTMGDQLPRLRYRAQMVETLGGIVRSVAGDDAEVRFQNRMIQVARPKAWGGTGDPEDVILSGGRYDAGADVVYLSGILEKDVTGNMETAYHEAFHRLQYLAFSEQELKVLDGAWARAKTLIGSSAQRYGKISHSEAMAVTFQRYGHAKLLGKDPVKAILLDSNEPTARDSAIATVLAAFDKMLDLIEKVHNFLKGNGFDSIRSIYERAAGGSLADQIATDFDLNHSMMRKWKNNTPENTALQVAHTEKVRGQIEANNATMDEIRRKAQEEGC